jgi:hypothetical protein
MAVKTQAEAISKALGRTTLKTHEAVSALTVERLARFALGQERCLS